MTTQSSKMFCYQCQETAGNKGCILKGVCGKDFSTANLMDLLIFNLKGISTITTSLRKACVDADFARAKKAISESLFATITNANFDYSSIANRVTSTFSIKKTIDRNSCAIRSCSP